MKEGKKKYSAVILMSGKLYGHRSNPVGVSFQKLTCSEVTAVGTKLTMGKLSGW